MKKLSIISNQIKNNTYSYTGKGSFEAVVNNNKDLILSWLEELIPLQNQINLLLEQEGIEFQKRNYTRILTKVFPEEYKEFVCLNILVRDANILAQYYNNEYNITMLYDNLIHDKYLKYPGKYEKYVEFNIFQKFVMMYRDELISSLNTNKQTVKTLKHTIAKDLPEEEIKIEQEEEEAKEKTTILSKVQFIEPKIQEAISKEEEQLPNKINEKDTNWTQLLLGKLK